MHVIRTIQLTWDFDNLIVPVTFCVSEQLHRSVILGLDFLTLTKRNIDIPSKVVTLYDSLVGMNLTRPADIVLYTVDAVFIPPRSEASIPVSVPPQRNVAKCLRHQTVIGVIGRISIESVNVIDNLSPSEWETKEETSQITLNDHLQVISQTGITAEQSDLSTDEYKALVKVLYDNRDLFATSICNLVDTDVVKMDIDTGDAKPVKKRAHCQSPKMMKEIEWQVQEMVSVATVEPSDSPWNSQCLLIKKSGFDMVADRYPSYFPILIWNMPIFK